MASIEEKAESLVKPIIEDLRVYALWYSVC